MVTLLCIWYYSPAVTSVDNDKVTGENITAGENMTAGDEAEQQVADEQTAEKVAPLFSQPATIITIETEACTHEVLLPSKYPQYSNCCQML